MGMKRLPGGMELHLKKGIRIWSISTNPTDGQTDDSATP